MRFFLLYSFSYCTIFPTIELLFKSTCFLAFSVYNLVHFFNFFRCLFFLLHFTTRLLLIYDSFSFSLFTFYKIFSFFLLRYILFCNTIYLSHPLIQLFLQWNSFFLLFIYNLASFPPSFILWFFCFHYLNAIWLLIVYFFSIKFSFFKCLFVI